MRLAFSLGDSQSLEAWPWTGHSSFLGSVSAFKVGIGARVRLRVGGEEQWLACSCEHKGRASLVAVSLRRQECAALWPTGSTSGK